MPAARYISYNINKLSFVCIRTHAFYSHSKNNGIENIFWGIQNYYELTIIRMT